MKGPFISRVQIKNFRNFVEVDVILSHKQVIVGENSSGKTNFLKAIQLILDPSLSDQDRVLIESDFHDSLESPMKEGEEIFIAIEIQGYEHNRKLVAQFQDAVVSDSPPTLQISYRFRPVRDENEAIVKYEFVIIKANNESKHFTSTDRSYINIRVVKALRDVERELNASKRSPLYQIVKLYDIQDEELEAISEELKDAADHVLQLDEIKEIKKGIQSKFERLIGASRDHEIELSTFDIDPNRLLYTLQVLLGDKKRPVSEISLGLCNILYITLILLLLKDRTVPTILKQARFDELSAEDDDEILSKCYTQNANGNYLINPALDATNLASLYEFMSQYLVTEQPFTILAVEEPEAHLHPLLQRLVYKEVLHGSDNSVLFTTHSTFITSIAPIDTIVHVRFNDEDDGASIWSSATVEMDEWEVADIERYLDVKRGELYFGRGIILVEGISEEYLVPKSAELFNSPLDNFGVIVCNIDSTNFKPYAKILTSLNIPWCLVTDGDYYVLEKGVRKYRQDPGKPAAEFSYRGLEIAKSLLIALELVEEDDFPDETRKLFDFLRANGCFVGESTLEVDIMRSSDAKGLRIVKEVFSELKPGGVKQQENFDQTIDSEDFWAALDKIESSGIGKGRFAQRLASRILKSQIPKHLELAIKFMVKKVATSK